MADPLVLTAEFDAATQPWLEALRREHFPPARNLIPAHLTLFHALPGEELPAILGTLARVTAGRPPAARIGPPRFLGRGVALEVASPALSALRSRLAAAWAPWLGAQDRQSWRPHVTVQNKVDAERARALHARLQVGLAPRDACVAALRLWHYRGGPWEAAGAFPLTAGARAEPPAASGSPG